MPDVPISLHDHILVILNERELRYQQRFQAQQEAIAKAEAASDKRAEAGNELRGTMDALTRQMMPRAEAVARIAALEARMEAMTVADSGRDGTGAGVRRAWTWLIAAVGLFVSLTSIWFIFAPAVKALPVSAL